MNMSVGEFIVTEVVYRCKQCKKIYRSNDLALLAPKQSKYCYDVIVHVGMSMFVNYKTNDEIMMELRNDYNIQISPSEIDYLGKKFIVYLVIAHTESESPLKKLMQGNGGYILHMDSTFELGSPHLMSFIDDISKIVLGSVKIRSEKSEYIIPHLEAIKEKYGTPIACVHDMARGIIKAVETVFPDAKDFICHYHFLRDIGKDLFESCYNDFVCYLKKTNIYTEIKRVLKKLNITVIQTPELKNSMDNYLKKSSDESCDVSLNPEVKLYLLLSWLLESKVHCGGYGFPFDRQHLDFYNRLNLSRNEIKNILEGDLKQEYRSILGLITNVLNNLAIRGLAEIISERVLVFDDLRSAMRIALPDTNEGLNDDGEPDIETIKNNVTEFINSERIKKLAAADECYMGMIRQIEKYWDKLFSDPIKVDTENGPLMMQPQRTNNILEQFFRWFKSGIRKKRGQKSVGKFLKTMLENTPLVKNLSNPKYMKIILDGEDTLAERFAKINISDVRVMLGEEQTTESHPVKAIAKILKMENFPEMLARAA